MGARCSGRRSQAIVLAPFFAAFLGCGSHEPAAILWPTPEGAGVRIDTMGPASISTEGRELVLDVAAPRAGVVFRFPHAPSPVALHLRARVITTRVPTAFVSTSMSPRGTLEDVAFALRKHRSREVVDLWFPLSRHWASGLDHSMATLSVPGAVLHVQYAELRRITPPVWLHWLWQEVTAAGGPPFNLYDLAPRVPVGLEDRTTGLRGFPPNFYLLFWLLVVILAWHTIRVLAALRRRLRQYERLAGDASVAVDETRTRRRAAWFLRAVLTTLVAIWIVEGAGSLVEQLAEYRKDRDAFSSLALSDVRENTMGADRHALALLVDRVVPRHASVKILPAITDEPTYRLASAILPRRFDHAGTDDYERDESDECRDLRSRPDYVATLPWVQRCFLDGASAGLRESCTIHPGETWNVPIPARGALALARASVVLGGGAEPPEALRLSLVDGAGAPLSLGPHGRLSPGAMWMVDLPPGTDPMVRVVVGDSGRDVAVDPPGLTFDLLPPPYVLAGCADDALVARRADLPEARPEPTLPRAERRTSWLELVRLLAGFALLTVLGDGVLRLVFSGSTGPAGAMRLSLAWLLGSGAAALVVHALTSVGLRGGTAMVAALALLAAAGRFVPRDGSIAISASRQDPVDRSMGWLAAALIALALGHAALRPMPEWDALMNFGYRAHLLYTDGPTRSALACFERLRPGMGAYPLLVPLLEALSAHFLGRWHDSLVTAPLALHYGAMIGIVWALVRPLAGDRLARLAALLAATGPMAMLLSTTGLADLPLASLFAAAILCLDRWDGTRSARGYAVAAGAIAAVMAFTKLEGGALRLLVVALSVLRARSLRREPGRERHRAVALLVALAYLPTVPWWIDCHVVNVYGTTLTVDHLRPSHVIARAWMLVPVASSMFRYLFFETWGRWSHWNATYLVLLAAALLAPRTILRDGGHLAAALGAGILGYSLIYVVSPWGVRHMEESLARILIHFYPVAVALAGRVLASALPPGADPAPATSPDR
ncbi:MAG: glycosyltransferase family 39 protein [Acidobacteriota bacterium]